MKRWEAPDGAIWEWRRGQWREARDDGCGMEAISVLVGALAVLSGAALTVASWAVLEALL